MNKKIKSIEEKQAKGIIHADLIDQIFMTAALLDIDYLKEFHERACSQAGTYDVIGIMDGITYFEKSKSIRGKLKRLEALINLVDILSETNDKMFKGDEMESIREIFKKH